MSDTDRRRLEARVPAPNPPLTAMPPAASQSVRREAGRWQALRDWLGERVATASAESDALAATGAFAIDAAVEAQALRAVLARMDEMEAGQ